MSLVLCSVALISVKSYKSRDVALIAVGAGISGKERVTRKRDRVEAKEKAGVW